MSVDQLRINDTYVSGLRSAVGEGAAGLSDVPGFIKLVIQADAWRERVVEKTGEVVHFERFIDFVQTPPLKGLGADLPTLKRLCRDDAEAAQVLATVVEPLASAGGDRKSEAYQGNGVTLKERGNNTGYLTARIARDRPDVLEQMKAGEYKSVRAAAKAAGIVKTPTRLEQIQKLWCKLTLNEQAAFIAWMEGEQ
jgi:hypothetical protein